MYRVSAGGLKHLLLRIVGLSGVEEEYLIPLSLDIDDWRHVAVSWEASSSTGQFFVDGMPAGAPQQGLTAAIAESAATFVVGSRSGMSGDFFDGLIDEVRVWKRARTAQEILQTVSMQLPCGQDGLVGYWKFNNDGGLDHSGFGNHLTPLASPLYSDELPFPTTLPFVDGFESGDTSAWTTTVGGD